MPQFDPTYFASQVFWLLICFGILLGVFIGVAVPRIRSGINTRSHHIQDMKNSEKSYLKMVNDLTKQMNHLKYENKEKIAKLLEEAHHSIAIERDIELKKIQSRFAAHKKEVLLDLEKESHHIREDIPSLAKEITEELIEKLLQSSHSKVKPHAHN